MHLFSITIADVVAIWEFTIRCSNYLTSMYSIFELTTTVHATDE